MKINTLSREQNFQVFKSVYENYYWRSKENVNQCSMNFSKLLSHFFTFVSYENNEKMKNIESVKNEIYEHVDRINFLLEEHFKFEKTDIKRD